MKKTLFWTPRILSIAFVLFVSLFSLDVFTTGLRGSDLVLLLISHLFIPIILLVFTILAWKRDIIGSVTFFLFAAYYVFMVGLGRHWSWYVAIPLPALIVGTLYLLNWKQNKKLSN